MSVREQDRFNGSDRFAGLLAILLLALVILYFATQENEAKPKQAKPQPQQQVEEKYYIIHVNDDGTIECPF